MPTTKQDMDRYNLDMQANPEEAFERFIDSLTMLPQGMHKMPDCSWCNWRRGDNPRNLKLCGVHQKLRIVLAGGR